MNLRYFNLRSFAISLLFVPLLFTSCKKNDASPERMHVPLPSTPLKVIAIIGSSTAEGVGATPRDSSWANKLKYQLALDNRNAQIINLARAGYTTFKVLPSSFSTADTALNVDKALSYNPNLIIISLPSNDVASGYTDSQILNNFAIITEKITAARIPFIITSTQPRDFSSIDTRRRLASLAEKLEAGFPGQIVNVYYQLATPTFYIKSLYAYGDGVHLNNMGHDVIFKSVLIDSTFRTVVY